MQDEATNVSVGRVQRGSAMLISMGVLIILTLLGTLVLQTVNVETDVAGAQRLSQKALYVAEAGANWGLEKLRLDYNFNTPNPEIDKLIDPVTTNLSAVDVSDPHCKYLKQLSGTCATWHELTSGPNGRAYGATGRFRVFVHDDRDEMNSVDWTLDQNESIILRALGMDARGAKRMIEVGIGTKN